MTVTRLVQRPILLDDGYTTVKLEPEFWQMLEEICAEKRKSLGALVTEIDRQRSQGLRASAIRVYILMHYYSCSKSLLAGTATGEAPNDDRTSLVNDATG